MAAATPTSFKPGQKVTVRARSKVVQGKFLKERPGAKGPYYDIDLGDNKVGSYRPSQVQAA
jgi:hypothetical protein